ncbi:MAG: DUF2891 domain-containing protein [Actinomycetota bacterium]|nr:DUF2891 domain-containing protein [Actinomycetota bacterium]
MRARRFQSGFVGVAILVAALASLFTQPAVAEAPSEGTWKKFAADRPKLYETLAPAFVDCFKRRDSLIDPLSPIFHGCIDWHSAVHAAYSHHVLYRRTDKKEYLDLAEAQISPQGVSLIPAEEVYQRAKAPDYTLGENPYGFGWFLILARERELSTKKKDFRDMADFAATQMVSWFETRASEGDAQNFILNRAHPNYSWSLINLDVWARYTKDKDLLAAVQKASKPLFDRDLDELCPVDTDTSPRATGFQPACLMRLAAAAHVWGKHVKKWVDARLPKSFEVPPVTDPANCHAGGLNFTRSFALYQLYLVTRDKRYRDNYVDLIRYHVGRPDLYTGASYLGDPSYLCYSHWVAQVGVRAISLSYEGRPSTPRKTPPL